MPEQSGQVRFELPMSQKTRSVYPRHAHGGGSVHESDKPDLIKMMGAITIIIVLHNIVYYTQKGCLKRHPRSISRTNQFRHIRPCARELMTAVSFPSKDVYNIIYGRSPDLNSTILSDFPVSQCPMDRRPSYSSEGCYRITLYSLLIILK